MKHNLYNLLDSIKVVHFSICYHLSNTGTHPVISRSATKVAGSMVARQGYDSLYGTPTSSMRFLFINGRYVYILKHIRRSQGQHQVEGGGLDAEHEPLHYAIF